MLLSEEKIKKLKYICEYKDWHVGYDEYLKDHISDEPIEGKEKVLEYLRKGEKFGIRCSTIRDYVANIDTLLPVDLYTDGEWQWNSENIYLFEEYNMELKPDFIKKVLG